MSCACSTPRPSSDPRREGLCVVCDFRIPPEWSSSNIKGLLARLQDIPDVKLSEDFTAFQAFCIAREEDGREHFGYRYLGRNNEQDAKEEIADLTNYALFGVLRRLREDNESHEDLAFTAIYHAFKAWEAISEIQRKERGAP